MQNRIDGNSWLNSLLSKMIQENCISPEEKRELETAIGETFLNESITRIVNSLLLEVFNDLLIERGLITISIKLSVINQVYLVISANNSKQTYLTEEDIRELLISSVIVARKADSDTAIWNADMQYCWDGFSSITRLRSLEKEHLKKCDYAVMVSGNKLKPVFEKYADIKTLKLIENELLEFKDHEIHGVENDILLTIQPIIKQKEEALKSTEALGTNLRNLSIFKERFQQQAVVITKKDELPSHKFT